MINTSYVPLEQPFRVIEYNGTLGIQIGTLIVTKELEGEEYAIEAHSHPVVSYVNNSALKGKKKKTAWLHYDAVEGVVWENVEVGQVNTMARIGEEISWEEFTNFCRERIKVHFFEKSLGSQLDIYYAYNKLRDWNFEIKTPPINKKGEMFVEVELYDLIEGAKAYCCGKGGLGLITKSGKTQDMEYTILGEIQFFETILRMSYQDVKIRPYFHTNDERYKLLTDMLNGHYRDLEEIQKREYDMAADSGPDESDD